MGGQAGAGRRPKRRRTRDDPLVRLRAAKRDALRREEALNPLRAHAENFRTYQTVDLDFPTGCVAIVGENGSGKSSLVALIDVGLFGPESRTLAEYLTDDSPDDLLLELEFEHAGSLYRTRRTYSPRGRGKSTLDFEQLGEDGWQPLTRESAAATQQEIERTLQLSRETFCASALLRQGDGAAFTSAQPRERKRILGEVLGLDRYEVLRERARVDLRAAQAQQQQLAGRAESAQELASKRPEVGRDLAAAREREVGLADQLADREREREAVAERWQYAREQVAKRETVEAQVREAQSAFAVLQAREQAAAQAAGEIGAARDEIERLVTADQLAAREHDLATLTDADTAWTRYQEASNERNRLLNEATDRKQEAKELRDRARDVLAHVGGAECDRCGQTLGREAAEHAAISYRADADEREERCYQLIEQAKATALSDAHPVDPQTLADARNLVAKARQDQEQRARLEERIRQLEAVAQAAPDPQDLTDSAGALRAKQDELAALNPVDLDTVAEEGRAAARRLEDAKALHASAQIERIHLDERLAQIDHAEQQLQALAAEQEALAAEVNLTAALERAFSPNGIPALIVENSAIPYLETEANRILSMLGGKTAACALELRTQAALKSGDGVRDTLDVIVSGPAGERPYETFSGGEQTRLNLALRIALARLLAHRRGAESRLLVIDEPDGLDEQGMAALVEVLEGLRDDFDKLYVVSHVPSLRDSFDTTLTVTVDAAGVSRMGEFAELAGVGA